MLDCYHYYSVFEKRVQFPMEKLTAFGKIIM